MQISLKQFLTTGVLGGLRVGDTEAQVRDLLGTPDAEGNTSRKDPRPSLLKYGDVEFNFAHSAERQCTMIFIERQRDAKHFVFPEAWIVDDWDLRPGCGRFTVEAYLIKIGLQYAPSKTATLVRELIILPSHVRVTFDEDELWSLAAVSPSPGGME